MASAVRAMVSKSLGALIFRNVDMATNVLESDDLVDQYRDRIFERLLQRMTQDTQVVSPGLQFILATRHLERIADHATNIAEDIIFWVRGLDVRHGRGLLALAEDTAAVTTEVVDEVADEFTTEEAASGPSREALRVNRNTPNEVVETPLDWEGVTDNSHALHSRVTGACETERA